MNITAGDQIRELYQKMYDEGADALDWLNTAAPKFAEVWSEYEGDLDSIIAELDEDYLASLAQELQRVVE